MKYDAVFFDMDGTVLDTLDDLAAAINLALRRFGLPERSRAEVRAALGNGAKTLVEKSVPAGSSEQRKAEVLAFYKPYYDAHCRIRTRPYEGILPMMAALKDAGVALAVVSNKPDFAVQELARAFFAELITLAVGEKPEIRRKPAPDMLLSAIEALGLQRERCLYVGDSEVDICTAQNAGLDCVCVCWGFRDREELLAAGAKTLIERPEELLALVLEEA